MKPEAWARRARWLAYFSIAYNLVEAGVALGYGLHDDALSLFGFGLDSLLESASAGVVLWHLSAGHAPDPAREQRATRIIGGLLITLAALLLVGAGLELFSGRGPSQTWPGIIVSSVSLAIMGWLYRAKMQAANALDSPTLREDAFCTKSCMWLSGLLLAGSLAFEGSGLSIFDALASGGMAWLIYREGREAWTGDACACGEHD